MPLLSLEEIQQGLDREFPPEPDFILYYQLRSGGVSESAVAECEKALDTVFPLAFRQLIRAYDFGHLTVGPVRFSYQGDYLKFLIELNTGKYSWGAPERPAHLLEIGGSDPYSILLDTKHGSMHALDPALGWDRTTHIASGFDSYFRGLGTAQLLRGTVDDREALAQQLLADVGGTDIRYWRHLAGAPYRSS
jgi:hypothetical protein